MSAARQPTGGPSAHRADRANKRMVAGYLDAEEFQHVKDVLAKRRISMDAAVQKGMVLLLKDSGAPVPRSLKQRLKKFGL